MRSLDKSYTLVLVLIVAAMLVALPAATATAKPKAIVVPDDYPTIQAAIESAENGATILVKSGTYQENPINTTKSLSIIGEGSPSTYLNLNCPAFTGDIYGYTITSYGRAINVIANDFMLSGFSIRTNGGDVSFEGNNTTIANNRIAAPCKINGYYLDISNNTFEWARFESGYGVNYEYSFTADLVLSRFCHNSIHLQKYSACPVYLGGKYNVFTDNTISGAFVSISSTPCFFSANRVENSLNSFSVVSSDSVITKNTIANMDYGFGNEGSRNIVFANQITNCGKVYSDPSKVYWPRATRPGNESGIIFGNNFIDNYRNMDCSKLEKIDLFDNGTVGNYWSDYRGNDSDGDGIGDTPYILDYNRSDLHPLMAQIDITAAPDLMPEWAKKLETKVLGLTDSGSAVALTLDGNITSSQMSCVKISANQTTALTTLSFNVIGQSNSTGFSNITIPLSAVPYGTKPIVYIDNQPALSQGYTQDNNNYYVWYTTQFSTHVISIRFTEASSTLSFELLLIVLVSIGGFVVLTVFLSLLHYRRRRNNEKGN